jgi:hypothetical protein
MSHQCLVVEVDNRIAVAGKVRRAGVMGSERRTEVGGKLGSGG